MTEAGPHNEAAAQAQAAPQPKRSRGRRLLRDLFSTRLDKSGARIKFVAFAFVLIYGAIAARLVHLGLQPESSQGLKATAQAMASSARPDILDRRGEILATDVKTVSVFAEPRRIVDKDEAVELLTAVLPDVDARELREKLGKKKGFVWVKREVTPKQREEVHRLGLPGVGFLAEKKRVYPNGPIASHVLGFTNIDNQGIAGIEKFIDTQGLAALRGAGFDMRSTDLKPVHLSIDLKATHALRDELAKATEKFKAKASAAAILDVNTGEVVAWASLPDYDPNNPVDALDPNRINRLIVGVYEMGSTFKAITMAMAMEANKVNIKTPIDARGALRYGRFTIKDFHAENRTLSVTEVFQYSSNVGTARMALMVGVNGHKEFLRRLGQLERLTTEIPESALPMVPKNWGELNTMTISFGHGLAVAPLQSMMAVGALLNGGYLVKPTFLKRDGDARPHSPRVVREDVSESMRYLMRNNAERGTATKANIPGYYVGGKTGTAEKVINGRYDKKKLFTTFMAVLPADKPKYLFLTVFDEPQGLPETHGYATAGWNGAPTTGKIIERITPLLDLPPRLDLPTQPFPLLARFGVGADKTGSIAPR